MKLSPEERDSLIVAGAPTFHQIEFLRDTLSTDALSLENWSSRRNRIGGRNPAAYIISEGMRRVFRRLRKKITYGNNGSGGPSTEFGREVEYALGAFGVRADWRRPTEEATNTQGKIAARLLKCQVQKRRKGDLASPPTSPDLTGIEIQAERDGSRLTYVISLLDCPHIPPFRMQSKNVPNGRDVAEYAYQWAASVRAAKA